MRCDKVVGIRQYCEWFEGIRLIKPLEDRYQPVTQQGGRILPPTYQKWETSHGNVGMTFKVTVNLCMSCHQHALFTLLLTM